MIWGIGDMKGLNVTITYSTTIECIHIDFCFRPLFDAKIGLREGGEQN